MRLAPQIESRAEPPRAVEGAAILRAKIEWEVYRREREGCERRSVLRGSILLALGVLMFSLLRAGADRAFYTGWWRQW